MHHALKLAVLPLLMATSISAFAATNMILNGDFESNSATTGVSAVNLTNAQFGALVASTTAFGNSNDGNGELDLYTTDVSYIVPPQSGAWQVRLHGDGVNSDAFSFLLSSPVTSGASYNLRFHASGLPGINVNAPVSVEIGVSSDGVSFGTPLYTSSGRNGDGGWHQYDTTFVAPLTAAYLTVRNVSVSAGVDHFTLSPVPEPGAYAMFAVGLGLTGFMVRRRRQRQTGSGRRRRHVSARQGQPPLHRPTKAVSLYHSPRDCKRTAAS